MDLYSSLPPRLPSSMPPTYASLYPASPPWPPPPPIPRPTTADPLVSTAAPPTSTSAASPPSSSSPSASPLPPFPADLDLDSAYPASPFDAVCLKHLRRYLQGYDRVYTRLLMEYGAERQRVNQQHWERVHRLQQQHKRKHDQLSHDADQQSELDGEYAEMKAELDTYHNAQLSDASRRFRTMIIALTQRLDHFLSTQVSPSELLQDVDVRLEARAAGDGRLLAATFSVRCVETFSDLRRRFVHWMREEQGDAVLAFTPDSQFCIPAGQVNASCRTNVHDTYVRQQHPLHDEHGEHPEEEKQPPSHSYSLARPLAAFRARATRARAGYGLKQPPANVEEESATSDAGKVGSGESSAASSNGVTPLSSHPPSPRSLKAAPNYSINNTRHEPSHHSTVDSPTTSSAPPHPSASSTSAHPASHPTAHASARPPPASSLLIVDEDVSVINFLPDFVHSLTLKLLGGIVLVSDQAANTQQRRHSQPPIQSPHIKPSPTNPSAASASSSPSSTAFKRPFNRGSLYAFSSSASKLPARLLPHLRQHFPNVVGPPPLPKFPPSLSALFQRPAAGQRGPPPLPPTIAAAALSPAVPMPVATPMPNEDRNIPVKSRADHGGGGDTPAGVRGDAVAEQSDGPSVIVSGSVDSDESESSEDSVHHVSITHSQSRSSYLHHDDDDIEPDMLNNRASLPPPFPSRPPLPISGRRRHHSHPLSSSLVAGGGSGSFAGLSVEVEPSESSRLESVSVQPSQSFSVDVPYVDYIDYDLQEDSRMMEQSRTYSQQSELDRESSAMREYDEQQPAYDEHEPQDEDDELLNTTGSTGGSGGGVGNGVSGGGSGGGVSAAGGRRRRRAYVDGGSGELSHSNSFSTFQSTPPSTQPTPSSISRPQSGNLELLAAGVLHLPAQPSSLPSVSSSSSLVHSTFSSVSSPPYILPTSPPIASLFNNPLLSNGSPSEQSHFLSPNAHHGYRVRNAVGNGTRRSS